jgi:hypothetical protein
MEMRYGEDPNHSVWDNHDQTFCPGQQQSWGSKASIIFLDLCLLLVIILEVFQNQL